MGKGGTKFVGDAVSVRRKSAPNDTIKNIKRNLDRFIENGVHPEIERMRQERSNQLPVIPDLDLYRPFVFLDLSLAGKPLGRLVVELFDDLVPVAANHFKNKCLPGSSSGVAGSIFHKLLPRYALHGGGLVRGQVPAGRNAGAAEVGVRLQSFPLLRAVEAGLLAVALSGEEFAITLDRALDLDRSHQVVGRIHRGRELLETLADLRTLPDDSPVQRLVVSRAGATNHLGTHEELGEDGKGVPQQDPVIRLQEQAEEARAAQLDALREGLKRKRKLGAVVAAAAGEDDDEDGHTAAVATAWPSMSGAGFKEAVAAAAAGGSGPGGAGGSQQPVSAGAAPTRSMKERLLDSMLGDMSGDSSEESSSDEHDHGGGVGS